MTVYPTINAQLEEDRAILKTVVISLGIKRDEELSMA